jgi:hypothetical protein
MNFNGDETVIGLGLGSNSKGNKKPTKKNKIKQIFNFDPLLIIKFWRDIYLGTAVSDSLDF